MTVKLASLLRYLEPCGADTKSERPLPMKALEHGHVQLSHLLQALGCTSGMQNGNPDFSNSYKFSHKCKLAATYEKLMSGPRSLPNFKSLLVPFGGGKMSHGCQLGV